MVLRLSLLILLMYCTALRVQGQQDYLSALDARDLPDTTRINLLNDHAFSISRSAPDSALSYAQTAARRAESLAFPKGQINAHTLLGILNKDRGYFGLAVEHYLEAMQMAEKVGDSLRVSGCLNNLGAVCQKQGQFARALEYFLRSLRIEEEHGTDEIQRSIRLYNIGEVYERLDSLDEAYAYFYNSLLIEEKLDNAEGVFYARLGIGKVDAANGNFAKSAEELRKAQELAKQLEDNPGMCEVGIALGELWLKEEKYGVADKAFTEALVRARKFGYQTLEMEALGGLAEVFQKRGNFERAIVHLKGYHKLQTQLNSAEVNSRIGELQARYQLEKKEQEIDLLREKNAVQAESYAYERKLRNYFFLTLAVAVVLIGFNLYQRRMAERRANG